MASSPLELYEPLDVIGNGSFGIIRKVRRKTDGVIFARKELNFERMTERDRKQIVSEVNILKELHHEHIVRYHDRHVDRDAGILYIVMEYCGGGDLSSVIKQAQRHNRLIPEDTIWNYFMQILLALNHCHHPNCSGRSSDVTGAERRPQILHRDLKPDNVFLDEHNTVKLGDFGLSKALPQASFANTYVGTPYYMSPELMQEKAYDSKSDVWSLGCLIYELCALKPPFHEAKTHAELSILIRNGRIPPLPKGYSSALTATIKSMLNLNPAMRPSASQLLQHERLGLANKVHETQKMLTTVKAHKANLVAKERDLVARESTLAEREKQLTTVLAQKDEELASLRAAISVAETTLQQRVRAAVARRDEELRAMVLKQEADVAARMARREEEIMEAVRKREGEVATMWAEWEKKTREGMGKAVEERMDWVQQRTAELEAEEQRLATLRGELEKKASALEDTAAERKGPRTKTPLEEVKNILAPLSQLADSPETVKRPSHVFQAPVFETPINRATCKFPDLLPPSAMKGVILTATGEPVATPSPAELAKLFVETPKVGLNFAKIFDFDSDTEDDGDADEDGYETDTRPRPAKRIPPTWRAHLHKHLLRLRAPRGYGVHQYALLLDPCAHCSLSRHPRSFRARKISRVASVPAPRPALQPAPQPAPPPQSAPQYDLADEENLPSPFIKKVDNRLTKTTSAVSSARPQVVVRKASRKSGPTLRAMAVVNAANASNPATRGVARGFTKAVSVGSATLSVRTSIAKAQRASEEARKALVRP
ncbi:G2-specific protein kinase nim-1 [Grifola frondosa]|uniref:non-specific serine/threonine protein kinase n=1 Tax=Grifola frondosa TaxID=5627 RepID=A0A1C7M201_GRIFR|nr:G2-specific protein kinase nim-1 [Grifola frondosa]